MTISTIIQRIPCWYYGLMFIFSSYYGFRGFMGQWVAQINAQSKQPQPPKRLWKTWEIVMVHCLHDFIFHVTSSAVGFISFFCAVSYVLDLEKISSVGGGEATLMVFFFLVGLIGICGLLPLSILMGKLPSMGK